MKPHLLALAGLFPGSIAVLQDMDASAPGGGEPLERATLRTRLLDLDGDGALDLLESCAEGALRVRLNVGARSFVAVHQELPRVRVTDVLLSDLDGDGLADLYLVSPGGDVALRNEGGGRFREATAALGLLEAGIGLAAERLDVDGDGLADLVVHNQGSDVLFWARADGRFEREAHTSDGLDVEAQTAFVDGTADATGVDAGSATPHGGSPDARSPVGAPRAAVTMVSGSRMTLDGTGRVDRALAAPQWTPGGLPANATITTTSVGPTSGSGTCAQSLRDEATAECLSASSIATFGLLFPYPGGDNTFTAPAVVAGGTNNMAGLYGTVGGGYGNYASGNFATVGGGANNSASGNIPTVSGGVGNDASGASATIGGGAGNIASGSAATVAGGSLNTAEFSLATVSGGKFNRAGRTGTVAGGLSNYSTGYAATIGGGRDHLASGYGATIAGGEFSRATGFSATIGGGRSHIASGPYATIVGGFWNRALGDRATVAGGSATIASGDFSFAAGRRARARHRGAFVWGDSRNRNKPSSAEDEFNVYAEGGARIFAAGTAAPSLTVDMDGNVGIGTERPAFTLEVHGTAGKPGGGSWSVSSDRRLKKNVRDLDGALEILLALRGVTFEYEDAEAVHELPGERIGFIAQEVEEVLPDWVDEFEGYKRLTIRGFEALAVEALRAQQQQIEAQRSSLSTLRRQNDELRARVARLEQRADSG